MTARSSSKPDARYLAMLAAIIIALATASTARGQSQELAYERELRLGQSADTGHDYRAAELHYRRALDLTHGHPDVAYLLARTEMHLNQPDAAIARLAVLAAMGLAYPPIPTPPSRPSGIGQRFELR